MRIVSKNAKPFKPGKFQVTIQTNYGGTAPRATSNKIVMVKIDKACKISDFEEFFGCDDKYVFCESIISIIRMD